MKRRYFLQNTGAAVLGGVLLHGSSTASAKPQKKKPVKYKLVYNQDCTYFFINVNSSGKQAVPEDVDQMVDKVAQGGADLMLINPNAGIGRVDYPSRVWQPMWDKAEKDMEPIYQQMKHLAGQGCDYLSRALERCRQQGIGAGVSIRMNDTHNTPWPDSPRHGDFYRQHPEWRLKSPYRIEGPYTYVYAMDYRRKEVRDYYLALIREIISEYKPDALELDFMRFPLYFPHGDAYKYSPIITSFVREVRDICGSKIFLMARLPVTTASAYEYGFNVAELTQKGMLDAITPTAHFITAWDTDIRSWRKAAGDNVVLYAGAESCAYSPDGTRKYVMGLDEKLLRGFAAANYAKGADGVYLFNFFCAWEWEKKEPLFPSIKQLNDPVGLIGKTKTYCMTAAWGNWHLGESDGPLQVPRDLTPRTSQTFNIAIGKEPPGIPVEVNIILKGEGFENANSHFLHINENFVGRCNEIREVPGVKDQDSTKAAVFKTKSDFFMPGMNDLVFRTNGASVSILAITVSI